MKIDFRDYVEKMFWVCPLNRDHQDNYICSFGDTVIPINVSLQLIPGRVSHPQICFVPIRVPIDSIPFIAKLWTFDKLLGC